MPPSLEGCDAWLSRAEKHFHDLTRCLRPFLKAEREAMFSSVRNPEVGEGEAPILSYTAPHAVAPEQASILVGETIQALRRVLDYLIFELAFLDSGTEQDDTQFPIEGGKDVFWARRDRTKLPNGWTPQLYLTGMSKEHVAAIEEFQPYKGADWSKTLQKISNPDKHRRLVFVRGQVSNSAIGRRPKPSSPPKGKAKVRRTRDGISLLWNVGGDMHVQFDCSVYVAFEDKAGVIDTLEEIKARVAGALDQFRPCFAGQCPH